MWNENTIEITSDYSTNGNKGLKITQSRSSKFIQCQFSDYPNYIGKNLKFSADISNPDFDLQLKLIQIFPSGNSQPYTMIPQGLSTHGEISTIIDNKTTDLLLRIEQINGSWITGGTFYTDNWCLEVIE